MKIKLHLVPPPLLFYIDNNIREKEVAWKLMDPWYASQLCNDTYQWFAIGIPLSIVDPKIQGDIDLLVKMGVFDHSLKDFKPVYRAFEMKTTKIGKFYVKSLKASQSKKYVRQLEKIRDFGFEQSFLLEVYILEPNIWIVRNEDALAVKNTVKDRIKLLSDTECGYISLFLEQKNLKAQTLPLINNLFPANQFFLKEPASILMEILSNFYQENYELVDRKKEGSPVICYCYKCKKLKLVGHKSDRICKDCREKIF